MKNIYVLENIDEVLYAFKSVRLANDTPKIPYAGNSAELKIKSNSACIVGSPFEYVISANIDPAEIIKEVFRRLDIDLVFE